jgi:hypothetical protein
MMMRYTMRNDNDDDAIGIGIGNAIVNA